jgi:hypothetical protein
MGSRETYPHGDLRPWVEAITERAGWERVMYGSEYPVIHWRNEALPDCLAWLEAVTGADGANVSRFLGGNAERHIFSAPPPPSDPVEFPSWVTAEFDRTRRIPLFENGQLDIAMDTFDAIHPGYVAALQKDPSLRFAEYVESLLAQDRTRP